MSDVSEHDSDSDTEISKKNKATEGKVQVASKVNDDITLNVPVESVPLKDVSAEEQGSSNIVKELNQQAASTQANEDRPEWENYMQQNQETGVYTYTDPTDGTVYEWDAEKRGWIPKIDDDFIALYQANYGFTATGEHDPNVNIDTEAIEAKKEEEMKKKKEEEEKKKQQQTGTKRKVEPAKWFDADGKSNTNVYVSGLPLSTTQEDFISLMSKYGLIMMDDQGKEKIKMYKTSEGNFKGDARCCYLKHESVVLACDLLDESHYNGCTIHVEQAVFQLKGEYNPALKPKKKKTKKKKGKGQDKLLDWVDRPAKRSKFDRIVILKNMFNHKEFEKDPSLINDLKGDLRTECETFGEVKKVMVFDRNPEGVTSILFHEPEVADKCIETLNGRFYAGRTISAETYDGKTNYQIQETEEELEKRLNEWEKFIGADEGEEDNKTSNETNT